MWHAFSGVVATCESAKLSVSHSSDSGVWGCGVWGCGFSGWLVMAHLSKHKKTTLVEDGFLAFTIRKNSTLTLV